MIEIGILIIAILFLGIGIGIGSIIQGRIDTKRDVKQLDSPLICGCKHHKSFHSKNYGCNGKDKWGNTCRCQQFLSNVQEDPFKLLAIEDLKKLEKGN